MATWGILLLIELPERGGDTLHGCGSRRIGAIQGLHRRRFDIGQCRTYPSKCQTLIHDARGRMIDVGRPVVAIEAVHRIAGSFCRFSEAFGRFRRDKLRLLAGDLMAHFDPGNILVLAIRGHVRDLIGQVHVPVDATGRPAVSAATSDLHEQGDSPARIVLIGLEVGIDVLLVSRNMGWPMALLARVPRRPQVVDRRRDGTWIGVRDHRIQLMDSREF